MKLKQKLKLELKTKKIKFQIFFLVYYFFENIIKYQSFQFGQYLNNTKPISFYQPI